jgi:hypothetical protein
MKYGIDSPPQNKEHWQIVANTVDTLKEEENF